MTPGRDTLVRGDVDARVNDGEKVLVEIRAVNFEFASMQLERVIQIPVTLCPHMYWIRNAKRDACTSDT